MPRSRTYTRRQAIYLIGGAVVWVGCGGPSLDLGFDASDSFDDVLDKLHTTDPDLGGGLANHGPMAIEALVSLGKPEHVVEFADDYDENLQLLEPGTVIPAAERESLRGHGERRADWIATYESELMDSDPRTILARDWPWLAAGMPAVAAHGVLRVGHAIRSFERRDSLSRRRELAHAIGYWAARRTTLPGTPGAAAEPGFDVVQALEELPIIPRGEQSFDGNILSRLDGVRADPGFAALVERVDFRALSFSETITRLCATSARALVDNGGGPRSIAQLHALTGSSILRTIQPWLDDEGQLLALGYAFQLAAALIASQSPGPIPATVEASTYDAEQLLAEAVATGDVHTVKLIDAVLTEEAIAPSPELRAAARAWVDGLG